MLEVDDIAYFDNTASIATSLTLDGYMDFADDIATPSSTTGRIFRDADNTLLYYDGSGWQNLASSGSGGTLDGSGAAGYVTYWSDADTLTYDSTSASFYWDATTDRLGLGTVAPSYTLSVDGTASVSRAFSDRSGCFFPRRPAMG